MAALLPLFWPVDGADQGRAAANGDAWSTLLTSVPALAASLLAVVLVGTVVLEPLLSLLSHRVDLRAQVVLGLGKAEDGAQAMLISRAAKANYFRSQTEHNWAFGAAVRAGLLGAYPPSPREDVAVAAEAILSAQGSGPDVTDHLSLLSDPTLTARVALLAQLFAGTSEGQRLRKAHTMLVAETERLATLLVPVTQGGDEVGAATAERAWGGALRRWQSKARKGKRHAAKQSRGGRAAAPGASGGKADESPAAEGGGGSSREGSVDGSESDDSDCSASSSVSSSTGRSSERRRELGRDTSEPAEALLPERGSDLPLQQGASAEALPMPEESMLAAALDVAADAVLQRWPHLATLPPPRDAKRPDATVHGWRDLNRDVAHAFSCVLLNRWRNNDADYGAVSAEDSGIIWRGAISSPGRSPTILGDSELLD
ncbi:hypothetical protein FNF28_01521 [Cafeteria roenbergensis]|uniref:Uncharacterized protein n=1 Tax=Cafeteria roenbergensis TaxID=33653 RepID=A0A5A8DXP2_CAFRO|nr:hypothetical protein FNF28_01521 [Cafeteria roenbergensis]